MTRKEQIWCIRLIVQFLVIICGAVLELTDFSFLRASYFKLQDTADKGFSKLEN